MKKIIKWLVFLCIVCAAIFVAMPNIKAQMLARKKKATQAQIMDCSELVSYKCRYSDVVYKDKALSFAPSTRGYSIVRFTALVTGGIADTGDISMDISDDMKSITVTLPPCIILSNDIEKEEAITEEGSFLRVSAQDMLDGIDNAREEVAQSLVASGFLKDADEHARAAMTQMMSAAGFKSVDVKTRSGVMTATDANTTDTDSTKEAAKESAS